MTTKPNKNGGSVREFWVLKENVKNGDVPTEKPDYAELFYHTVLTSEVRPLIIAIEGCLATIAETSPGTTMHSAEIALKNFKEQVGDDCV